MHTRHAAVGLVLALAHTGCLVPAHEVRALFAESETRPFSTLFVGRTDSGEMLELGYDHSDRDHQRPWIQLGTREHSRFRRTFRSFGQGNHSAFHHGAEDARDGTIYAVAGAHGTYHLALVALSSRGDVLWAVETPLLRAPTFGHPSVVLGKKRVWVLVGLRERERRSLLVASVGADGRGQAATIVRDALAGGFPSYPLATRFDAAVANERIGLTLAVAETGRRAPWIARFDPAADLSWIRELRGPPCLETAEAAALDVTSGGDTLIALRARCGLDPVADLAVARIADTLELGWLTIVHRTPPPGWPPRGGRDGIPGFGPFPHAIAARRDGGAVVATTLPAAPNGNTRLALFELGPAGAVTAQQTIAGSTYAIASVRPRGADVVVATLDAGDCVFGRHASGCGGQAAPSQVASRWERLQVAGVQRSSEPVTLEWVDIREQLTMAEADRGRTAR